MSSEEKRNSGQQLEEQRQQQKLDLYVIARIITVLKEQGKLNRTNLATSTGLAYNKLTKYLDWMNDKGLLQIGEDGTVALTEEGAKSYEDLVSWILRYIGRVRFPRI